MFATFSRQAVAENLASWIAFQVFGSGWKIHDILLVWSQWILNVNFFRKALLSFFKAISNDLLDKSTNKISWDCMSQKSLHLFVRPPQIHEDSWSFDIFCHSFRNFDSCQHSQHSIYESTCWAVSTSPGSAISVAASLVPAQGNCSLRICDLGSRQIYVVFVKIFPLLLACFHIFQFLIDSWRIWTARCSNAAKAKVNTGASSCVIPCPSWPQGLTSWRRTVCHYGLLYDCMTLHCGHPLGSPALGKAAAFAYMWLSNSKALTRLWTSTRGSLGSLAH